MKLIYFVIASIFLFNPLISNIDILPDFIAYLLIMKALWKDTYTNANAEDAFVAARNMLIVSVAKTLSIVLVSAQDISMSLLLSFSFLVVELIFGIPFVLKLFKFLSDLATNAGNGKVADKTVAMRLFTIVIVVVRLVLAVLPDLTALTLSNGIDTDAPTDLTPFRPMLILVTFTISFIACLVWLVIILVHFKKLLNREVVAYSQSCYQDKVSNNKTLIEGRNSAIIFTMLAVFGVLAFDLRYGPYTVTPDFLLTLGIIGGFVYLFIKGYYKPKLPFILLSISAVGQIAIYVLEALKISAFYSRFKLIDVSKSVEASRIYSEIVPFSIIGSIFFVCSIACALLLIYNCGKEALERNKNLFSGCDFSYQMKEYDKKMLVYSIITLSLSVACAVVYSLMIAFLPEFDGFVLINYIVEIGFIFAFLKVIMYVNDEVYKRIYSYS